MGVLWGVCGCGWGFGVRVWDGEGKGRAREGWMSEEGEWRGSGGGRVFEKREMHVWGGCLCMIIKFVDVRCGGGGGKGA